MWKPDVRVTGGFWLLLGWFGLANGWKLLLEVLTAAALHELGHILVLRAAGADIRGMKLSVCGAVLDTDTSGLSYGQELAAVLAGPGMNALCALLLLTCGAERWATAVGIHLALCGFNLLPLRPLDGGRALFLLLAWICGPAEAEWITGCTGGLLGCLLGGGLCWVVWRTEGSVWLLPAAAGLFAAAELEWRQREEKI